MTGESTRPSGRPARRDLSWEDLGVTPPRTGRFDALRDLKKAIPWKWAGVGRSPEPVVKPDAVLIDDRRVDLYWPEKGWGATRLFFVCPLCDGRSRFLYELPGGALGCHEHVSGERVRKEAALSKLRRVQRMRTNPKHRARSRRLQREAEDELWSMLGLDEMAAWAKREVERAKAERRRAKRELESAAR